MTGYHNTVDNCILEDDGIINRKTYAEEIPVKVEYSLSVIGETLRPIFDVLTDWGNNYKKLVKPAPQ